MTGAHQLLPRGATPAERSLAFALTTQFPDFVRDILDPDKTFDEFLPFLAAHESVDLWYPDWSEERRRLMVKMAPMLARLIGTPAAAPAFLAFVDAVVIHKREYPQRKSIGRFVIGRSPTSYSHHKIERLVKVDLQKPKGAMIIGRTAIGRASLRPISLEPQRRAKRALTVAKAPETLSTVTFAHRVPRYLDEGYDLSGDGYILGTFKDRKTL